MLKGVEIYLCLTMPNDPKRQQTEVGLCLDTGKSLLLEHPIKQSQKTVPQSLSKAKIGGAIAVRQAHREQ